MSYYHPANSLLTASVPISARLAEPMTISELDSHPDSARLWATLNGLKEALENKHEEDRKDREHAFEEEAVDHLADGLAQGYEEAVDDLAKAYVQITTTDGVIKLEHDLVPSGASNRDADLCDKLADILAALEANLNELYDF